MTTIDQLPAATASADTDLFVVSQNGIDRQVTRAQVLAGTQTELALAAGQLLGRASAGTGQVETIAVGANLALANGTLTGTVPPFAIGALPPGQAPSPSDIVPLEQRGADAALTYGAFMAGVGAVPGVPASAMLATPTGAASTRSLADILADAVTAEAFGARGDGASDDTAALTAAIASGQPVRLGAKTYVVNGQWTIAAACTLIGVPGQTVLRRISQTGGAWIAVTAPAFRVEGITFDANTAVAQDSWGVLVTPTCLAAEFERCVFTGAAGVNLGSGLVFQASDPALTQHVVRGCEASHNAVHGIWVQAVQGVAILECRAHDNGQYGVVLDYTDPTFQQKLHRNQVIGCRAWANARGISVGNFNATNTTPAVWGNANPDAHDILVLGNACHDNAIYGIAASGRALSIVGNLLTGNGSAGNGGAGILANVSYSRVAGNMVTASGQYGIDAGGSIYSEIDANTVDGAVHGINPGGSQGLRVRGNRVQDCSGWAVLVNNVETDGAGNSFGIACTGLTITDNTISFAMANGGGGVLLTDAPQNVLVARNAFIGLGPAGIGQCLWANTNAVLVEDNSWNYQPTIVANPAAANGVQQLLFPDIADAIAVTAASGPVQSMLSLRQQALAGQIAYIAITAGGAGYTHASVTVSGDGSGATAAAVLAGGALLGVVVTAPGAGYTTASVAVTGDGSGAAAQASVGLPVPEGRRLRIRCDTAVSFAASGSAPAQVNWTQYETTVPADTTVTWTGVAGRWVAGALPLADYLAPSGGGGFTLRSAANGDLVMQPAGGGRLRIASAAEPAGIVSTIGRGSPEGVLSAPPGSDYRNLDGGAFTTLWIKQTGTDAGGWVAVA